MLPPVFLLRWVVASLGAHGNVVQIVQSCRLETITMTVGLCEMEGSTGSQEMNVGGDEWSSTIGCLLRTSVQKKSDVEANGRPAG